ncbi:MAG: DUF1552 domain-containing protein [Verrucomicrobia bacterium]|nr:DUF1552 domain-containing protein [Verrucomicrobiota bacterium]
MKNWRLPRRTFLRGLGTAMALPVLDAMAPLRALAAENPKAAFKHPRRLAFLYIPNGADMANWTPQGEGAAFDLPPILEPLAPYQEDILVLSGLAHDKARPNGDGAGDHARASATFLTAAQARKTAGADIHVGVSIDQVAATRIGHHTRLPSLELGCDKGQRSGNCDSGYSCAYSFNISWKTPNTPMPPEVDPRLVFERLFAGDRPAESAEARARRQHQRKSILDFVQEDAQRLRANLGYTDQRKLDEYLTAVRELELRIEQSEKFQAALPDVSKPTGIPETYERHLRLLFDLQALAFQTDTTRISSFILAHDGSNRPYPWIGVSEGHHDLSHHGNDEAKKAKIARINRFHMEQFAYFLGRLKAIKEGEGTLLDNCMIVYGGAISDGDRHNHDNLPVILAGRGGGTIETGRHLRYPRNTPMANLFLSLLDRAGAGQGIERFGDSSGRLARI